MSCENENQVYTDVKKLPKEYAILQLRENFNKLLLEEKIITYDIFSKMQKLLMKKMNKIILESIEK